MGEPSLQDSSSHASLEDLRELAQRKFPGYSVVPGDTTISIVTIHGVGATETLALRHALKELHDQERDGRAVRQILDDVLEDLRNSGMSRERHDSLQDLLNIASECVNAGVVSNVIPWILVPGLTREIETLRQRVGTRLAMKAQDMKEREKAKARTTQKSTHAIDHEIASKWADIPPEHLSAVQRLRRSLNLSQALERR